MMMSSHHRLSGSLILDEKSMAWLVNRNFTGLLKSGFQGKTKRSYNLTYFLGCKYCKMIIYYLWLTLLI